MMECPIDMTFDEFMSEVKYKYDNVAVIVSFVDDGGEHLTIDSDYVF
jgi:hypothetical protein